MDTFEVSTDSRCEVVDVTEQVRECVPTNADRVTVFSEHTTTGVTVNEAESRLLSDFETALSDLVPDSGWQHDEIDDNADAHVRSLLLGPDVTIPVVDGSLALGRWQSVLFVECDGPRRRTVRVV
jgi:secondary thiamine-phosphate synthase enzyme